jgi:hypothetical protein
MIQQGMTTTVPPQVVINMQTKKQLPASLTFATTYASITAAPASIPSTIAHPIPIAAITVQPPNSHAAPTSLPPPTTTTTPNARLEVQNRRSHPVPLLCLPEDQAVLLEKGHGQHQGTTAQA